MQKKNKTFKRGFRGFRDFDRINMTHVEAPTARAFGALFNNNYQQDETESEDEFTDVDETTKQSLSSIFPYNSPIKSNYMKKKR